MTRYPSFPSTDTGKAGKFCLPLQLEAPDPFPWAFLLLMIWRLLPFGSDFFFVLSFPFLASVFSLGLGFGLAVEDEDLFNCSFLKYNFFFLILLLLWLK